VSGAATLLDGGLERADVRALIAEHLADMRGTSPEESVHALPDDALAAPGVHVVTARGEAGELLGMGALAEREHRGVAWAELKSMRTREAARGRGVAAAILERLVDVARKGGYEAVYLETGTHAAFAAAHRLYERHGFEAVGPFGDYAEDPHSAFYRLAL